MAVKGALDADGIEVPLPQQTVSLAPGVVESLPGAPAGPPATPG